MAMAKRLQPTSAVLRELYLRSGNQCAFPDCIHTIVNSDGNYVGQICHIEAAEEGGQRFNPNQTNEERRALSNLMLFCYDHHIKTNDVQTYTVEVLQRMKREHEDKYTDIVGQLQRSISDLTGQQTFLYSESGERFFQYFGWNYREDEAKSVVEDINGWVDKLKIFSPDTRQVFCLIIQRSSKLTWGTGAIIHEITEITGKTTSEIVKHIILLNKYGFVYEPERDEDLHVDVVLMYGTSKLDWHLWLDIKEFCEKNNIDLDDIIIDLNFTKLD
ncbi:hypothetical protein [Paenibacillus taichungensis]|uniref:hypothetical protein n=1 Tax=Paenibacillus taichungensis TaxID=484184 RepID=UPI0039A4E396